NSESSKLNSGKGDRRMQNSPQNQGSDSGSDAARPSNEQNGGQTRQEYRGPLTRSRVREVGRGTMSEAGRETTDVSRGLFQKPSVTVNVSSNEVRNNRGTPSRRAYPSTSVPSPSPSPPLSTPRRDSGGRFESTNVESGVEMGSGMSDTTR